MTGLAEAFAFTGSAFLSPDADRVLEMAAELGDPGLLEAASSAGPLELEYNRLFLSPSGSLCALWQSAWVPEKHLMGEPHLRALDWFRRYDVEPAASNDPADHVGLLLLFYARLLDAGAPVGDRCGFARDHLAWVPGFCDQVTEETRHPFYRLLAGMTRRLTAMAIEESDETEDPRQFDPPAVAPE
jgi:TorA maturation chaperone TorD